MVYLFLAKSTMHLPHAINYAQPPLLRSHTWITYPTLFAYYLLALSPPLSLPLTPSHPLFGETVLLRLICVIIYLICRAEFVEPSNSMTTLN